MKTLFFMFIVVFFSACSLHNSVSSKDDFNTANKTITHSLDACTSNSYTSKVLDPKYGKLFIEEVSLQSNCFWNGLPRSLFENLFKTTLNIDSLKVMRRLDYSNYEFTTYLVNGKYYINLIYAYSPFGDKFILDYKGLYFEDKIRKFDPVYINTSSLKQRFPLDYDNSLVKQNIINNYFQKERPQYK